MSESKLTAAQLVARLRRSAAAHQREADELWKWHNGPTPAGHYHAGKRDAFEDAAEAVEYHLTERV